jgi:acyl carrier protein
MTDRLLGVVAEALSGSGGQLSDSSGPMTVEKWDSLRHLMIMHLVEESFSVKFSPEEIEKATSIGKIRALLQKYGVSN